MTRERDIERVLDAWFKPGPTEMPDRLFDDVLARVDRLPQRRAVPTLRFPPMNSRIRWLALAAAALVVAVAGLALINRPNYADVGTSPTPSPSSTPVATSPLPAALRYLWVGETRSIPDLSPAAVSSGMKLSSTSLEYFVGDGRSIFFSAVALEAPNLLRFEQTITSGGCESNDVGTYSYALSPGGTQLTLTTVGDVCASRAAAIAGPWNRSACPSNRDQWCLGDIEAGTHVSVNFTPFVPPIDWVYNYGRFSYTVPDGWIDAVDCQGCYQLARRSDPENTGIYLFSDVVAHSQGADQCNSGFEPGIGRTAAELTDWLTSLPGFDATTPQPITVGGLTGSMFDLTVSPGWTATCPYSNGFPMVSTFRASDPASGFDWNVGGTAKVRYILLDLGDGRALLIDVEAPDKATWDSLVADAMPVINTFEFLH